MNYKMTVTIADPKTPAGMCSDLVMNLKCRFAYNPQQYGNGHYVSITVEGEDAYAGESYDLRYDKTFDFNWTCLDECSRCGYHDRDRKNLSDYVYCPMCGAIMDLEE